MSDSFTLYCLDRDHVDLADVEAAAGKRGFLASLLVGSRVTVLERAPAGQPTRLRVRLGAVDLTLNTMPEADRADHLIEARNVLDLQCDVWDEAVLGAITTVRSVLGVVIDPSLDSGGRAVAFLKSMATSTGALILTPDGTLLGPAGTRLAALRQAPGTESPRRAWDGLESAAATREAQAGRARQAPAIADEAEEDGDLEQHEPPDASRVARRALVMTWLCRRAFAEQEAAGDAREVLAKWRQWLDAHDLNTGLEPAEQQLVAAPPGLWLTQDIVDRGWSAEAAAVLAWALGLMALPPHDEQVDPQQVADRLGLFADAPAALASDRLQPAEKLEWLQKRLLAIHWRLRQEKVSPGPVDFTQFEQGSWWLTGVDLAGIPMSEQDLAVGGAPLTGADPDAVRRAGSIAMERHRAINWLCGDDPTWSQVDLST